MCFYITATLPKDVNLEEFYEIFEQFKMSFIPIKNSEILHYLHSGEQYLRATKSYCDCDTVLGSLDTTPQISELKNSKKVKKLKQKKWTEEQIQKWIENKIKQKKTKSKLTPIEQDLELENWMKFLSYLLSKKNISRVGLLKHWYHQSLEKEEIIIKRKEKINIDKLNKQDLLHMEEDVIYEFFRAAL
ncbi:MAG: hypothetical protein ACFFBP_20370 [Promethearchaeota archaeon]